MASITKHQVVIKDLSTRSVTLYPTCARVIRDIPSLVLQPGANEIEINGLAPTVDEHSVQFEGHGSGASITDMSVELVPNRDIFEETFPEFDKSADSSDSEDEDEEDDNAAASAIKADLEKLEAESVEIVERQRTANKRLEILDDYIKAAVDNAKLSGEEVVNFLQKYEAERLEQFAAHTRATAELKTVCKQIERNEKEFWKAGKETRRRQRALRKEKNEAFRAQERKKSEKRKELNRARAEQEKFWPKKVYRVTLGLDVPLDTPASSRRGSTGSTTVHSLHAESAAPSEKAASSDSSGVPIALSISYVTKEAFWTPQHDIAISSLKNAATIQYHAELTNNTSETWTDARISLCSSQTSFSGLNDDAPTLQPWQIKLVKSSANSNPNILSDQEAKLPHSRKLATTKIDRDQLFGVGASSIPYAKQKIVHGRPAQTIQSALNVPWGQRSHPLGITAAAAAIGPVHSAYGAGRPEGLEELEESDEDMGFGLFDGGYSPSSPIITYEESAWEDNGLTSTYDLPGNRTLQPSSLARRYTIATLQATSIQLSHFAVPKLRTAAFLRTSVCNPSSTVTLLPGAVAITLDASFLGTAKLPRVAPNETFTLSLGVDPAVHVSYTRGAPHKSVAGSLFAKETALRFNREIWLRNTRNSSIDIHVLDQVPESLDERLRVEILQPRGLQHEGPTVPAGSAVSSSGKTKAGIQKRDSASWGKATASMLKNGKVAWDIKLDKEASVLLALEYETRLPVQEEIASA